MAQGIQRLRRELPERLALAETLPGLVGEVVEELRERLLELDRRITEYDHRVEQLAKQNEATRRLMHVAGVGPLEYARSQPGVIAHYLRLCFWPAGLCLDYRWRVATTVRSRSYASLDRSAATSGCWRTMPALPAESVMCWKTAR